MQAHAPTLKRCDFRFYAELNDFLPVAKRQTAFTYRYTGNPTLKDAIQAQGVPHTEVDLILKDGHSQHFDSHLSEGAYISVYPVFERFDIQPLNRLRPKPLRVSTFILDVHLGKLCRYLRLLGFDTLYRNDYQDPEIIRIAQAEQRIVLTRDLGILKQDAVSHGYFVRAIKADEQIREVIQAFDLKGNFHPFSRCISCNDPLQAVVKKSIVHRLPPGTRRSYDNFFECAGCHKLYWRGAHYAGLCRKLRSC